MWTPRRISLAAIGLVLFCGGFALYSSVFGWIDGLPPLPAAYVQPQGDSGVMPERKEGAVPPLQARLRLAFGVDCVEQTRTYSHKFESREKGLLFAAGEEKILEDGRIGLRQVSVAIFGKGNPDISTIHADVAYLTFDQPIKKIEDMGTRKIVYAELQSDPEAKTYDPRKGKIHITNNRKTADPDDDIILTTPGPLYYVDEPKPSQPHIWTFSDIELIDRQSKPSPAQIDHEPQLPTVTGVGMRVFLKREDKHQGAAPHKKKEKKEKSNNGGGVDGVERIELDSDVRMNIWSEARSMTGAGASSAPKQPEPKKTEPKQPVAPEEKVLVQIQTNGPFSYDMKEKDEPEHAHFEIPARSDPTLQEYVKVTRRANGHNEDTLTSDYLDVYFTRGSQKATANQGKQGKQSTPPKGPPKGRDTAQPDKSKSPQNDLEIDTLHAWGKNIALSSDQDSLFAFGNDLFYNAREKTTIMKGLPMHAVKEGNLIRCPELKLVNFDDPLKQHTEARGPGMIGMGEINPKTQEHGQLAHWKEWMVVDKVKEQGRDLDLVILTGDAQFLDTVNDQRLSGKQLKVWLLNAEEKKQPAKQSTKTVAKAEPKKAEGKKEERKQTPHRVEAIENVSAHSPDLIVHQSDHLWVYFKDVPPRPNAAEPKKVDALEAPPAKAPSVNDPPPIVAKAGPGPGKDDPPPAKTGTVPAHAPPGKAVAKKDLEAEKKDPPIELRRARRVETWVNRIEGKNELDKVHTEGNVHVHQDKTPGNERDVDIIGNTVDMENYPEGHYLIVTGNEQLLGEVHFDKISIIGDDIRIDQRDNTANVAGPGSMRMLSTTDAKGEKLEKPTWIDIYWEKRMDFDGAQQSIHYEGKVAAKQLEPESAKNPNLVKDNCLLSERMQVRLDRPVYLNQSLKTKDAKEPKEPKGKKGDDNSPKIDKILCDQIGSDGIGGGRPVKPVSMEEIEKINGRVARFKLVLGTQIDLDNTNNKMITNGPGFVRIFQPGAKDPLAEKKVNPKVKQNPPPKGLDKLPIGTDNFQPKAKGKSAKKGSADEDEEEDKLTWVRFDQRMIADNKLPKRSIFFSRVEVVHMPATRYDEEIDIAHLPPGAMLIRCSESFEVITQSRKAFDKNGKEVEITWQEMVAMGNVDLTNDDFEGTAKRMTYSEDKSQVILTGTADRPAKLNRSKGKGVPQDSFSGQVIKYNTKTKDTFVEKSVGGTSN